MNCCYAFLGADSDLAGQRVLQAAVADQAAVLAAYGSEVLVERYEGHQAWVRRE